MTAGQNPVQKKLFITGDGNCGKTSLLRAALHGPLQPKIQTADVIVGLQNNEPFERVPGTYEYFVSVEKAKDILVRLIVWDSAGSFESHRLDPLQYLQNHVFLIGFSIDSPASLENVEWKWKPEAAHHCPGVPIILVGLKKDLRDTHIPLKRKGKRTASYVTKSQGEAVARTIGAYNYIECSCLTGEGVRDVFKAAAMATLKETHKGGANQCCVIV
ncbi:P-loop containing nucleoside triphosphate hydrolase protein [Dactylonectria macrodidyma]|uniref:P-loop containing nucleoside triphosphate hydrolase protein n=1 Tax=Dactylonectria macrodidyma TaxID=307937 RepID=A0A9P9D7M4_9HYPO|nr:P-loop containing nucleoside triphosphate hydrolase protein [Dactylonectria macrodidyma]